MTYEQLKTAIQNYVQNSDSVFTASLDDFIKTSEDRVYRSVQMPAFWKTDDSGTLPTGTEITLPAGSVEVFDFRVSETDASTNGPWRYLLRKDWDFLMEAYPGASGAISEGIPKYYAVNSAQASGVDPTLTVSFAPAEASGSDTQYQIDYYGKTAAMSIVSAGSTWLSVTFPDILLYGSLAEAYSFMKGEPGLIQYYEQRFAEGLATMGSVVTGEQATVGNAA